MDIELTDDQRAQLESYVRSSRKIQAIKLVRGATGAGLREAYDYVVAFEQLLDAPMTSRDDDMGMSAQVIGIGPFSRAVVDHLAYDPERYADTQDGVPVITVVFECFSSEYSRALAGAFDIDPWDFNHHKLDPTKADLVKLKALFDADELDGSELIGDFVALRDAGFEFYYLPNG